MSRLGKQADEQRVSVATSFLLNINLDRGSAADVNKIVPRAEVESPAGRTKKKSSRSALTSGASHLRSNSEATSFLLGISLDPAAKQPSAVQAKRRHRPEQTAREASAGVDSAKLRRRQHGEATQATSAAAPTAVGAAAVAPPGPRAAAASSAEAAVDSPPLQHLPLQQHHPHHHHHHHQQQHSVYTAPATPPVMVGVAGGPAAAVGQQQQPQQLLLLIDGLASPGAASQLLRGPSSPRLPTVGSGAALLPAAAAAPAPNQPGSGGSLHHHHPQQQHQQQHLLQPSSSTAAGAARRRSLLTLKRLGPAADQLKAAASVRPPLVPRLLFAIGGVRDGGSSNSSWCCVSSLLRFETRAELKSRRLLQQQQQLVAGSNAAAAALLGVGSSDVMDAGVPAGTGAAAAAVVGYYPLSAAGAASGGAGHHHHHPYRPYHLLGAGGVAAGSSRRVVGSMRRQPASAAPAESFEQLLTAAWVADGHADATDGEPADEPPAASGVGNGEQQQQQQSAPGHASSFLLSAQQPQQQQQQHEPHSGGFVADNDGTGEGEEGAFGPWSGAASASPWPLQLPLLDDPELKTGRHRTVVQLLQCRASLVPYVSADELKDELNEQFRARHPNMAPGVTLSKLRKVKRRLLAVAGECGLERSTVALAYVLLDTLLRRDEAAIGLGTGGIGGGNSTMSSASSPSVPSLPPSSWASVGVGGGGGSDSLPLYGAVCLYLAAKFNDAKRDAAGFGQLHEACERLLQVPGRHILLHEFDVFAALSFGLFVPPQQVTAELMRLE